MGSVTRGRPEGTVDTGSNVFVDEEDVMSVVGRMRNRRAGIRPQVDADVVADLDRLAGVMECLTPIWRPGW